MHIVLGPRAVCALVVPYASSCVPSPLGFLVSDEIAAEGNGNGGMNGQHDQIVALKWVQQHIEAWVCVRR